MKKEKVFLVNQTGVKVIFFILGIVTLLMVLASMPAFLFLNLLARAILSEIDQTMLLVVIFGLVITFMFVFLFERLIITENQYIYKTLFYTHEYPRKTHRIVGRGAKEEYHHRVGDEGGNTDYWKQLDILNKNGELVLELKVRCSKRYYEKMISYLKVNEWDAYSVGTQSIKQEAIHFELKPSCTISKKQIHPSDLFSLVTGGIVGGMIYNFIFQEILSQGWALLFILLGIGISSLKIVDFNRYQVLTSLIVTTSGLKVNEKVIPASAIYSLKISSSEDENHSNGTMFLFITFDENDKKRTIRYMFTISVYERIVYREIEDYFTQVYGKQGKFQLLYVNKQEKRF